MKKIILIPVLLLFIFCEKKDSAHHFIQGEAFGTTYNIQLYSERDLDFKKGLDSVIDAVNHSVSTYIPQSDISKINNYVGFIGNFKNEYNIFKVKNMEDKRSKGARCDQSGKSDSIKLLNMILDENKYTTENTKGRNKIEFCILQELILRKYDKENENNKRWFLRVNEALINNIEKLSF